MTQYFKPALLARMAVVPFYTLRADAMKGIVKLKLEKLKDRLMQNNRMALTYTGGGVDQITEMTVTGAVDGSVVEDAYRAILSVRRELLDLLDRSASEDAFKEKAHELLMYAVAGGIDMGPELKTPSVPKPSAIAVFPTPGSPMSTGLFLVRRLRIWITRRISSSRPITGSSLPLRASWVRSRPYLASAS